jgi:ATP-dependent protease ClpP protease subunit
MKGNKLNKLPGEATVELSVKPDYDGEMIVVAAKNFSVDRSFPVVVGDSKGDNTAFLPSLFVGKTLWSRVEAADAQKKGLDQETIDYWSGWAEKMEKKLKQQVNPELAKIILEGKLKLAFLLNSSGGDREAMEIYRDMIDHVAERGGRIEAYVTQGAASAAFDVAGEADKLFALEESLFAWHRTLSATTGKLVTALTTLDIAELRDFIKKAKSPWREEFIKRGERALRNPRNPDGMMVFEGQELAEAGVVEKCFTDIEGMRTYFGRKYRNALHPQIWNFWETRIFPGK